METIGIDTIGSNLGPKTYTITSTLPIPKTIVSPWNLEHHSVTLQTNKKMEKCTTM